MPALGGRRLHLFGLVSDGGVHSQQAHIYALLRMAKQQGVERVFLHCFMDGRDTLRITAPDTLSNSSRRCANTESGKIATCQRPLLRHGSRQALGSRVQSFRCDGDRQRRGCALLSIPCKELRIRTTRA